MAEYGVADWGATECGMAEYGVAEYCAMSCTLGRWSWAGGPDRTAGWKPVEWAGPGRPGGLIGGRPGIGPAAAAGRIGCDTGGRPGPRRGSVTGALTGRTCWLGQDWCSWYCRGG